MSGELKPCPVCLTAPTIREMDNEGGGSVYYVLCCNDDCPVEIATYLVNSEEKAIANWNRRASPWINFDERRPEDGQHCWYMDDMTNEPEDAWYHADEQMFQAEPYEIIYPVNAKWFLWQPCEIPAPPSPAEIERAKGESK